MVELAFGPLAGPECRRALSGSWVRVAQVLAAIPSAAVAVVVLWMWWFFHMFDPTYQPNAALLGGILALERIMLVVAMVLSPAMIAGTLAGEKARGVLPLLLACSISTREIVTGRLAGRLALVGVLLLANLPGLCLLGGLAALPIAVLVLLFVLPLAVAIGTGGISLLASALSRRARDALLAVYLLQLVLFVIPIVGWSVLPGSLWEAIGPINPFYGLRALVGSAEPLRVTSSCLIWLCLGLFGTFIASWRLRIEYLRQVDVSRPQRERRRGNRPPVGDDPMLWKEIHFERVGRFSRFLWWLGAVIFIFLLGVSLALVATIVWGLWVRPDSVWSAWGTAQLQMWVGSSALPLSWLIQWTMGLRAAVAVSSEREHGTWDALLLSSLEGGEIIRAKIWGNLYSLRGFLAAAAIVWTLAALTGAMELSAFWSRLANTIVFSVFITAAGVWISLLCSTATRAMTLTIGTWLIAAACFAALASMIVAVIALVVFLAWLALTQNALFSGGKTAGPPVPMSFETGWTITRLVMYAGSAFLIALYCRYRFDTLAGRITQSKREPDDREPLRPIAEEDSICVTT